MSKTRGILRSLLRRRRLTLFLFCTIIFVGVLKVSVKRTVTTFQRSHTDEKENVFFIVAITTAPARRARRDAIRSTYWRYCQKNTKIRCFFFTDGNVTENVLTKLQQENLKNKDMILQPTEQGRRFGLRFLHQILWISRHFNFSYFLHADDDYFLCLNKLTNELQYRPQRHLVWGFFYCLKNLVYVDEAWILFSRDVIEQFLSQNSSTMVCHPHSDQQIAIWLNDIPSRLYFHDQRLHHYPRAAHLTYFNNLTNICDTFVGVHGAYEKQMVLYDQRSNDGPKVVIPKIPEYRSMCRHWGFNWTVMGGPYRYKPEPCKDNPEWAVGHQYWRGAEGGQS